MVGENEQGWLRHDICLQNTEIPTAVTISNKKRGLILSF
jgi:hypothetical protein